MTERSLTRTTDFIAELFHAANTIHLVSPPERRRLIEQGIATANALHELLGLNGSVVAIPAHFMEDMPKLAEMAERPDAVDVIVAAGMLMLAGEVQRLRVLCHAVNESDRHRS